MPYQKVEPIIGGRTTPEEAANTRPPILPFHLVKLNLLGALRPHGQIGIIGVEENSFGRQLPEMLKLSSFIGIE
jgi:hypothetical protein